MYAIRSGEQINEGAGSGSVIGVNRERVATVEGAGA
jgi:hypothetical protein